MGKIFCVEFQRVPLNFHTKCITCIHTLKDMIFFYDVTIVRAVKFQAHMRFWKAPCWFGLNIYIEWWRNDMNTRSVLLILCVGYHSLCRGSMVSLLLYINVWTNSRLTGVMRRTMWLALCGRNLPATVGFSWKIGQWKAFPRPCEKGKNMANRVVTVLFLPETNIDLWLFCLAEKNNLWMVVNLSFFCKCDIYNMNGYSPRTSYSYSSISSK